MNKFGSKKLGYQAILVFIGIGIIISSAAAIMKVGESLLKINKVNIEPQSSQVPRFDMELYNRVAKYQRQNTGTLDLINKETIDPGNQIIGRNNPFAP